MDTNTLNDLKGKHIEHDAIKVKSPKKKNILSCKSGLSLNKESNVENITKHYELESMNQKENICNRKIEITCNSTGNIKTLHKTLLINTYFIQYLLKLS